MNDTNRDDVDPAPRPPGASGANGDPLRALFRIGSEVFPRRPVDARLAGLRGRMESVATTPDQGRSRDLA
jgi:hypothetical protein